MEIWKPAAGFEGMYEVSNLGRVRNVRRAIVLKPKIDSRGYVQARLFYEGIGVSHLVHSLVANAFICCRQEGKEVNHLNGVKTDNRAENLKWVTRAENCQHAYDTGLRTGVFGDRNGSRAHPERRPRGERATSAKLTENDIRLIRADTRPNRAIAADHGVSKSQIGFIKRGIAWAHVK